jgi:hypothetical protein
LRVRVIDVPRNHPVNTGEYHHRIRIKLERDETCIAAEAIKTELETERARQLLKLHSLVSSFPDGYAKHVDHSLPFSAQAHEFLAESLALDPDAVTHLCESVKGLCGFDVESRLMPLVAALQASADVPPKRLGQMIGRWPGVLALTNLDVLEVTGFLEHEAVLPVERSAPNSNLRST